MMLIVEHFFLIALNPDTGLPTWPRRAQAASPLAAAALLLELAQLHCLQLHDDLLRADATLPLSHALLGEALHALAARPLSTVAALRHIEQRLQPLLRKVLDGLYQRDILHRSGGGWLSARAPHYPLRSMQARDEAIAFLHQAISAPDDLHGL